MRKPLIISLALVLVIAVTTAFTQASSRNLRRIGAFLTGYEEVPTLSTPGNGQWTARISRDESQIDWVLSFGDTETPVTQAHIHFAARAINGPIVVFFCSNLGNGPPGTQACPANGGEISGTIRAGDVLTGGTSGIAAGEFEELIAAIRAGATYANVHTTGRPGGEIRGQIGRDVGDSDDDDHDDR